MARRLSRQETIDVFRADMARLLGVVELLSVDERAQLLDGGWNVKDVLAHIAAWDRELVRGLQDVLRGRRPRFAGINDDDFNAAAVEASRARTFQELLAETRAAHTDLMAAMQSVTDEEWQRRTYHTWGKGRPMTVASLFYYLYKGQSHYGGHAADIKAWRDSQRSSPMSPERPP